MSHHSGGRMWLLTLTYSDRRNIFNHFCFSIDLCWVRPKFRLFKTPEGMRPSVVNVLVCIKRERYYTERTDQKQKKTTICRKSIWFPSKNYILFSHLLPQLPVITFAKGRRKEKEENMKDEIRKGDFFTYSKSSTVRSHK